MRKIILVFIFLISISFVLAQSIPSPHGFYGTAKFTNGTDIPDGYIITGEVNNVTSGSCVISNGTYDLVVTSNTNGEEVKFYIQGEEADQPSVFIMWGITELNITIEYAPGTFEGCGDGVCSGTETCSICPTDCGSCPDDSDSQSSSGGSSSGGSGGIISPSPTTNESGSEENTIQTLETEKQGGASPGITGAVIGFLKSGKGIALLITFILIIILGIGVVTLKRKSPKNE